MPEGVKSSLDGDPLRLLAVFTPRIKADRIAKAPNVCDGLRNSPRSTDARTRPARICRRSSIADSETVIVLSPFR